MPHPTRTELTQLTHGFICHRLLKTSLKFSGPGTPVGSGVSRKQGFVRRLSHLADENYNPMQSSPVAVSPSKVRALR